MDCLTFEIRLEALLGEELGERPRQECLRHAEVCAECQELLQLAGLSPVESVWPIESPGPTESTAGPASIPGPPVDLVDAVLAATSGPVCGKTRERLCDSVDGQLSAIEKGLVEAHCATCEDCRRTAEVLAAISAELHWLAEMQPDTAFVSDVLARTLPAEVRLRRWWQSSWSRWVQRPRFAWEAAYAATLAIMLISSTFGSSLDAVPTTAVQWGRSAPWSRLERPAAQLEASVADRLKSTWQAAGAPVVAVSRTRSQEFARQGRATWTRLQADLGTVGKGFASLLESADEKVSSDPVTTKKEK